MHDCVSNISTRDSFTWADELIGLYVEGWGCSSANKYVIIDDLATLFLRILPSPYLNDDATG